MKSKQVSKEIVEQRQVDAQLIVKKCLNPKTDAGTVRNCLGALLKSMEETLLLFIHDQQAETQMAEFQSYLDIAQRSADVFRKNAQRNHALKYYYMGEYQANLDRLQEKLTKQREQELKLAAVNRKNFSVIMSCLYQEDMIQQAKLSKRLHMDKGNLSREMEILIAAGFAEQRKAGKYKYYNLSGYGTAYYKKHILPSAKKHTLRGSQFYYAQYSQSNDDTRENWANILNARNDDFMNLPDANEQIEYMGRPDDNEITTMLDSWSIRGSTGCIFSKRGALQRFAGVIEVQYHDAENHSCENKE